MCSVLPCLLNYGYSWLQQVVFQSSFYGIICSGFGIAMFRQRSHGPYQNFLLTSEFRLLVRDYDRRL